MVAKLGGLLAVAAAVAVTFGVTELTVRETIAVELQTVGLVAVAGVLFLIIGLFYCVPIFI